jgi:general secretion pathway protein C
MEQLVKRYFWVLNLVVLALIAGLSAQVVNNIIAGRIVALPTTPRAPAAAAKNLSVASPAVQTSDWANAITERNLFNSAPVTEDASDAGAEETTPTGEIPLEDDENCRKADGRIGLFATMVAQPSEWSLAVVNDGVSTESRVVKEETPLADAVVKRIYRRRLVLQRGGQFECVELGQPGQRGTGMSSATSTSAAEPPPPADGGKAAQGVKKLGENKYEISREMLNEKLENLAELGREARVIPHYRDGKPQGFKLVGIRPGSLYSQLGLRSGDVIKGVNDEEITSPNKALELYEKLKNSSQVGVEIERRGRREQLDFTIK